MTDNIRICARTDVPTLYPYHRPTHMISLTRFVVPLFPTVVRYLKLDFDDLSHDSPASMGAGYQGPTPQDIAAIIGFAGVIPKDANTLIHCDAGISRSTAALLIVLTVQYGIEWVIKNYHKIVAIRPQMFPNKLMIRYADDQLRCEDKLNRVCHAILLGKPDLIRDL